MKAIEVKIKLSEKYIADGFVKTSNRHEGIAVIREQVDTLKIYTTDNKRMDFIKGCLYVAFSNPKIKKL